MKSKLYSVCAILAGIVPVETFAAAGALDSTFGSGGIVNSNVGIVDVAIQSDGKLVVVGTSFNYDFHVARYNSNGTLDTTFGVNGVVTTDLRNTIYGTTTGNSTEEAFNIAVQADGKILAAGYYWNTVTPTSTDDIAVVRYLSNGSVDTSFGTNGVALASVFKAGNAVSERGYGMAIQGDGKIVVVGEHPQDSNVGDYVTVRFTAAGAMDTSFAGTGYVITSLTSSQDVARDVAIDSNGKIVVAGDRGNTGDINFGIIRYNANGTADTSFGPSGIRSVSFSTNTDRAYGVAIGASNKVVVGGYRYTTATNADFALARLNSGGTLDTTFDSDGKVTTDFGAADPGSDVMIQSDGKIVMVGTAGVQGFGVSRYNTNGSLDASFGSGGKVITPGTISARAGLIQSDGKIVAAGGNHIVRYLGQ